MLVQIAGKNLDLGDSLQETIEADFVAAVTKYFDRAIEGNVTVTKDAHLFEAECRVALPSGIALQASGEGGDARGAFEDALEKLEKRVRRYKRRLRDHHRGDREPLPAETASSYVVAASDEDADESYDDSEDTVDAPVVVAETKADVRTMTASMAVMQLELSEIPALMFRNAVHGGLNMVYRRSDGHIGWVDPGNSERKTA